MIAALLIVLTATLLSSMAFFAAFLIHWSFVLLFILIWRIAIWAINSIS